MCGIAGIIAESETSVRRGLTAMLGRLTHRGPDDEGVEVVPFGRRFLGLGHRRLSVIDLSPAGHQPMAHPGTGDQIVFNGEVYNFEALRSSLPADAALRGRSDTEVMLHLLARDGPDACRRFDGMYAFAFLDRRNHRLVLARDPLGIKPLYLARTTDGGGLVFASEVRAVLASGLVDRRLSRAGVAGLLAYGAVQQPLTMYAAVRSLPPGGFVTIQPEDLGREAGADFPPPTVFWRPPTPDPSIDHARAVAATRAAVEASVRDHLVSDVPVGVFLSSGLDSTIVAGLAARHTPHLRSFTVDFADQPDASEADLAADTAGRFGLRHTKLAIPPGDAEASVVRWLEAADQPSIDGFQVYLISRAVRAAGIVVALSGLGGDELFGGYPSFRDVPRLRRAIRRLRMLPAPVRSGVARLAAARAPHHYRQKLADMFRTDGGLVDLALLRRRSMSDGQLASLGLRAGDLGLTPSFLDPSARASLPNDPDDATWTVSVAESMQYQGNMLLRDADVTGMAHGLEIRVPMIGQQVVDAAMAIPGAVRLPPGSIGKPLLRDAFADLLRPALLDQPKRGFALPFRQWMAGPLRPMCEAAIAGLKRNDLLEPAGVDAVWRRFVAEPDGPNWSRAFALVVLGSHVARAG